MNPVVQPDGAWTINRNGEHMLMPSGGFFFDGAWPCFDDRDEDARIEATGREAERLMRESDRATMVMAGFHAFFFQDPSWLLRAAEDPEAIEAENERYLATYLTRLDKLAARIGGNAQLVEINGDLGAQRGPMFGPKTFDRLVRPYLTRLCAAIHAKTDWKIFLHSCGGFLPLIPGVIASGVDVINPVQVAACGMDPVQLKARFGDQLIFWGGGCDTQNVLGRGSPAEVAANVRHLSGILGKGGGFVFNQVHNIMGDVPPANVCAMFDAARACAPLGATAAAAAG
jgi:uroporphyrinogen decarboxylase